MRLEPAHPPHAVDGTPIVLAFSIVLFAAAGVDQPGDAWARMDGRHKVLTAAFHGVTPRTAGFNSIDWPATHEGTSPLTTC